MDKKAPTCAALRDHSEPEHCNARAQKVENYCVIAPHMAQILRENTPMDSGTRKAIPLPELAATYGANPRSVRNAFYLRPQDFPPAIYLPGCRGPRFLVDDVQAWLEARKAKTQPAQSTAAAPKPQGRPRKASALQIARARQGQGGAA
ncbi:hypothetical protein HAP94_23715 [Acidithiobacillus ferrivorans]|nr:hypothetical protein [Acidithiobacillus ferrivorans]